MQRLMCVMALLLAACGPISHTDPDASVGEVDAQPAFVPPAVGATVEALIGTSGGLLSLEGAEIEIPGGALSADTMIRITVSERRVEDPFVGFSPIYRFEPAGLQFSAPVRVSIPFAGDENSATVFWTVGESDAFAALETEIIGGRATALTEHFSQAFVGSACTQGDCCGRGQGQLDVLLAVDSSNSMVEEQTLLAAQIPRMVRALATGDLDGDGIQDVPALQSVRIGTVSADMGTGGYYVPTCARPDFGDDGLLNRSGRLDIAGCDASYPAWAQLEAGASDADLEAFVQQVSCTAQLGTGGCGYEQQLESIIKAVTPSTSSTSFFRNTLGHADGANDGFLRPDSILATIVLSDEDDCSASDSRIFDPSSGIYQESNLNLRCTDHPEALHETARFVQALQASRTDPEDVVFALIGGVPAELSGADPASILEDPRMEPRVNLDSPLRLESVCNTDNGLATPAARLVDVARQLPGSTVQSICQGDFAPAMDAILRRVAERASGSCAAP